MEEIVIKIALCIFGLYLSKFLLSQIYLKSSAKTSFVDEYKDILNNPKYKVKRSYE